MVRLLMTAPGVGAITAMAVVADIDRFKRSSSTGAYLGLTPRRYESGEISRNGRISKRGYMFTRKGLFEAANAIFCRNLKGSHLRTWAKAIAAQIDEITLSLFSDLRQLAATHGSLLHKYLVMIPVPYYLLLKVVV
jgi:transposase